MFTLTTWEGVGRIRTRCWGRDPNVYITAWGWGGIRTRCSVETLMFTLPLGDGAASGPDVGVNDPNVYISAWGEAHPDQMFSRDPNVYITTWSGAHPDFQDSCVYFSARRQSR